MSRFTKYNKTEKGKARNIKYKQKFNQYINDYKLSQGCSICGYNKCAAALDFHHNGDKDFVISRAIYNTTDLSEVKAEIEKCELLCSNCHRELHGRDRKKI